MGWGCSSCRREAGETVVSTYGDEVVFVGSYVLSDMGGDHGLLGLGVVGGSADQGSISAAGERVGFRRVEKLKYQVGAVNKIDGG